MSPNASQGASLLLARLLSIAAACLWSMYSDGSPLSGCGPVDWSEGADVPSCPQTVGTLLPETYPSLGYVVSDLPVITTPSSEAFTERVTLVILEASGTRTPLIFLPVRAEAFGALMTRVKAEQERSTKSQRWTQSLRHVTGGNDGETSRTWQQDYWLPVQDSRGLPVFRQIPRYGRDSDFAYRHLARAAKSCPLFSFGESIPPLGEDTPELSGDRFHVMPNVAGNALGLPGGLVVVGDKASHPAFTRFFTTSEDDVIRVPTSYMQVGQVDELVKVLPDSSPGCGFAIALASPDRALELLKQDKDSRFFSFYSNLPHENADSGKLAYRFETDPAARFCAEFAHFRLAVNGVLGPSLRFEQYFSK